MLILFLPAAIIMERSSLQFLFGKSTTTATVVDEAPGEEVMLRLSNFTEKWERQSVMIKDAATVPLCHDMSRRKKSIMILEMLFPKPGGACVITRI